MINLDYINHQYVMCLFYSVLSIIRQLAKDKLWYFESWKLYINRCFE